MARISRIVVPGYPHHVTQRGVRSMDVFDSDEDRWAYISFLSEEASRFGLGEASLAPTIHMFNHLINNSNLTSSNQT